MPGVVVKTPRKGEQGKTKWASAQDIRRGVAYRLINAGVSAETLKVVMRHCDFATTEKYYGATKQAQAAAAEVSRALCTTSELMGGLVGGLAELGQLSREEMQLVIAYRQRA